MDGVLLDEAEGIISLDASSVSSTEWDYQFDTLDSLDDENMKSDVPPSMTLEMDMSVYPYDEERSMDGVLVNADADVSQMMEDTSEIDSWTELSEETD
jgi:hypothetical protein